MIQAVKILNYHIDTYIILVVDHKKFPRSWLHSKQTY